MESTMERTSTQVPLLGRLGRASAASALCLALVAAGCTSDKVLAWPRDAGADGCAAPWTDCDDEALNGCEANLNEDPVNCGGCGNSCAATAQCSGGACGLVGVDCGGRLCGSGQSCCFNQTTGESCYDTTTEICDGYDCGPCDGPEDCDPGQFCCHDPPDQFSACVPVCATDLVLCSQDGDCRPAKPFCCPVMTAFSICSATAC